MTHEWMGRVREGLGSIGEPIGFHRFLRDHYVSNTPLLFPLRWPAHNLWSVDRFRRLIGDDTLVEVQTDRTKDQNYEINSYQHKCRIKFRDFVRALDRGPDNDVYMTAQNAAENREALAPIWDEAGPIPDWMQQDPSAGYLWLGRDTTTPLHHDETNNLLCQVFGTRHIRMFPHDQIDKLDYWMGVHSHLGWVTNEVIEERRLVHQDVTLLPGQALFLPIGWWHCIRTTGISCMVSYTNFIFPNFWGRVGG